MSQHYYGSGSEMSADLKRIYRRSRATNPKRFVGKQHQETRRDKDGVETTSVVTEPAMSAMLTPLERHQLSIRKWQP